MGGSAAEGGASGEKDRARLDAATQKMQASSNKFVLVVDLFVCSQNVVQNNTRTGGGRVRVNKRM